jgi:hypothetical protein
MNPRSSMCFVASQVPDFFAALTTTRPAAVISPAASSRSTRALFNADQALFGFRGVNICMWKASSIGLILPSTAALPRGRGDKHAAAADVGASHRGTWKIFPCRAPAM